MDVSSHHTPASQGLGELLTLPRRCLEERGKDPASDAAPGAQRLLALPTRRLDSPAVPAGAVSPDKLQFHVKLLPVPVGSTSCEAGS